MSRASARLRSGIVAAFAALLSCPWFARAHTPGLSLADFEVLADGEVRALVTFASSEPLGALRLDRDDDGVVTPEEVSAAQNDLQTLLFDGVGVDADGSACPPTFHGASLTEVDGLALLASYACPSDAAQIEVTLYYLSTRARGAPHKSIARIAFGSATTEAVLTAEHRALALSLPTTAHDGARHTLRVGVLPAMAVALGLALTILAWTSRRWRAARAPWQNRSP